MWMSLLGPNPNPPMTLSLSLSVVAEQLRWENGERERARERERERERWEEGAVIISRLQPSSASVRPHSPPRGSCVIA